MKDPRIISFGEPTREDLLQTAVEKYFSRLKRKYAKLGLWAASTDDHRTLLPELFNEFDLPYRLNDLKKQKYEYLMGEVLNALKWEAERFAGEAAETYFSDGNGKAEIRKKRRSSWKRFASLFSTASKPKKITRNSRTPIKVLRKKCLENMAMAFDDLGEYDSSLMEVVRHPFRYSANPYGLDPTTPRYVPDGTGATGVHLVPFSEDSAQIVGEQIRKIALNELNAFHNKLRLKTDVSLSYKAISHGAASTAIRTFLDRIRATTEERITVKEFKRRIDSLPEFAIEVNDPSAESGKRMILITNNTIENTYRAQQNDVERALKMRNLDIHLRARKTGYVAPPPIKGLLPSMYHQARKHIVNELEFPEGKVERFINNLENYSGRSKLGDKDIGEMYGSINNLLEWTNKNMATGWGPRITDIGVTVRKTTEQNFDWLTGLLTGGTHTAFSFLNHKFPQGIDHQKHNKKEIALYKKSQLIMTGYEALVKGLIVPLE